MQNIAGDTTETTHFKLNPLSTNPNSSSLKTPERPNNSSSFSPFTKSFSPGLNSSTLNESSRLNYPSSIAASYLSNSVQTVNKRRRPLDPLGLADNARPNLESHDEDTNDSVPEKRKRGRPKKHRTGVIRTRDSSPRSP